MAGSTSAEASWTTSASVVRDISLTGVTSAEAPLAASASAVNSVPGSGLEIKETQSVHVLRTITRKGLLTLRSLRASTAYLTCNTYTNLSVAVVGYPTRFALPQITEGHYCIS